MYQSRTVSYADGAADRLGNAALADLDCALAMMGIAQWAHAGSRWSESAGTKIDRSRVGRPIPLLRNFRGILRDRVLAVHAKRISDPRLDRKAQTTSYAQKPLPRDPTRIR